MLFLTYVLFCFVLFFALARIRREVALGDETRLTTLLFLYRLRREDNDFAGDEQTISMDELVELTEDM